MTFDFDAAVSAPFRMQPGLRRLTAGAQQLTPMRPGSRHQREKLAVLSAFAHQALVVAPGFDPTPALDALCRHVAAEHPSVWTWDDASATAQHLGVRVDADGSKVEQVRPGAFGLGDEIARAVHAQPPAWRLTALLSLSFEEDLAIVVADDTSVPWMAVALPSHWAPQDKVGLPFAQVHAPVADAELLRRAASALTRLVVGPERWERFVWNVTDSPRLHAHPLRVAPDRWSHDPEARGLPAAWFRSERQTFVPVPAVGQSVFTIHVEVQALAEVVRSPERARQLADAVASMSPAVLAYRGLDRVREPLLHWLAGRAAPGLP